MDGAVERSGSLGQAKDLAEGAGEPVLLNGKKDFERRPHLNANERQVLSFLASEGFTWDFGYSGFARIMDDTKLERKAVRRACRSLARKGLAEYGRGLWNDDGEPAGSGYCATRTGVTLAETWMPA